MKLINLMNNISFNLKVILIGLISITAVLVPAYLVVSKSAEQIVGTEQEILGFGANNSLINSLKLLQIHRGLSSGALNGNKQQADQLVGVSKDINKTLSQLQINIDLINSTVLTKEVNGLIDEWETLDEKVNQNRVDAPTSFVEHTKLIDQVLKIFWDLGIESGLWYDPEVTSYHLIIASMDALPKATESLAKIRGLGNSVLTQKQRSEKQAETIALAKNHLMVHSLTLNLHLDAAINSNNSLSQLREMHKQQSDQIAAVLRMVEVEVLGKSEFTLEPEEFWSTMSETIDDLYSLNDAVFEKLRGLLDERMEILESTRNNILIVLGVLFLVFIVFGWSFVRSLKVSVATIQKATSQISNGNYDVALDTERRDEFGELNLAMLSLNQRLHKAASVANENARIRSALDSTSSNVMLADVNRTIIYMNKSVEKMLRESESELRKVLPHFSVDKIIGSNMDIFHKNPSHQSNLLANLTGTYVGNIVVAGISFRLIANPIFNERGERLGSVVEWINRTKEVATEHELSRILGALETATTNVMIADPDRKIIYMNKSVENMLRKAESGKRYSQRAFSLLSRQNYWQQYGYIP